MAERTLPVLFHRNAGHKDERRSNKRQQCQLPITWRLLGDTESLMTTGKVCDLSTTGMALCLDAPVRAGGILVARLEQPPAGFEESFLLRIKHVKPAKESGWLAGCSFTRAFSEHELQALLSASREAVTLGSKTSSGRRENRSAPRADTVKMLSVRLKPVNLLRPEVVARLKDHSRGGLGLVSTAAFPVGTILNVRLDDSEVTPWVQVRIKHCRPQQRQWLLGCQFTEIPSPAVLAQFKG